MEAKGAKWSIPYLYYIEFQEDVKVEILSRKYFEAVNDSHEMALQHKERNLVMIMAVRAKYPLKLKSVSSSF